MKWFVGIAFGALALGGSFEAAAQSGHGASAGVFSKTQADRGGELYAQQCARCHGGSMEGLDVAPPLTGPRFMTNYLNQPVAALATRIRTSMPLDMPGSLGLQASADLSAAILSANGFPAGDMDMPSSTSALQTVTIDSPPSK